MRTLAVSVSVSVAVSMLAASAYATPVATSEPEFMAYGAVFPDPLAVCQQNCDPNSRGQTSATQFIGYTEFVDAITFMNENENEDWKRYMEVLPLDGHKGAGGGKAAGDAMWPGNNLQKLEWTPEPEYQSAGLATSTEERQKSDLIVVRVTDENVPDKDKKRYALSLSIHGIERAGAEGGIRAMEEIVTAVSEGRGDLSILPKEVRAGAPSFREVLANTIIYFTLPNPDGWRRGSVGDTEQGPGVFYQRYNGNGIDPNRDWSDVGFQFRGYSGASEPETRAFTAFYHEIRDAHGDFAAGDDLHGQPFADALSYTLMPHGRHDIDKDFRIREASKLINRAQYEGTKWSPMIIDNDVPNQDCVDAPQLGNACAQIYAQTWGSVYDTINYTTTGTLGDWFDSALGIGADGIDNEMSFSHIDKNIAYDPNTEQLHVAGNKAIIFGHLGEILRPPGTSYSTLGTNAYVPNNRLTRAEKQIQAGAPAGTSAQTDIDDEVPTGADPASQSSTFEFKVQRDFDTFNGGMRVDVRATNVQGIGSGNATLEVQCKGCDEHVGVKEDADWITVASDFNQSFIYAQAGMTAAVNRPDATKADGSAVEWRALVSAAGGAPRFSIDFSSSPATTDGATGGDDPPRLAGYDVANTDFFRDLNDDALETDDKFDALDPLKVISGEQTLDGYRTLVLADEALPGYYGLYKGEVRPTGPPTADFTFAHTTPTTPGGGVDCERPGATEVFPFTIGDNDVNAEARIHISWELPASDYDLYLYEDPNGNGAIDEGEPQAASPSAGGPPTTSEEIVVPRPEAGHYVIEVANCNTSSEADPWSGTVKFKGVPAPPQSTVTAEQKDAWMAKLRDWVSAGGNLVLTDGAVRAIGELTGVPGDAVKEQTVYVGQTAFQICTTLNDDKTCAETKSTLTDPLARNLDQPAARFNTGARRQTYESTPIGYAIQNENGANQAFARQYDVDLLQFTAAGGRAAGGSANAGAGDAQAVPTRVTLGEVPLGQGHVRILGGLLPQPSTQYDHPLGIEPYSLTYSGYLLFCNLVDCTYEAKKRPALGNEPAPPGPVDVPGGGGIPGAGGGGIGGRIDRTIGVKVKSPRLASDSLRGRKIRLRIRGKKGLARISHFVLQYRRTGRGTKRTYTTLRPQLAKSTKRLRFKKGKIGATYLFRITAIANTGRRSRFAHSRTVFPYDDRGKGRRYSRGWKRVKNKRAWRGGFSRSSRPGATLRFKTRGGGRVYLIGRTGPNGGKAVFGHGSKRKIVSFKSKKRRNRRVVAVLNRTDKRAYRLRVRVLSGTVMVDGIGVRRR